MHKSMGCKAQVEVKYRSNLSVVRILTKPATRQTAFYAPRHPRTHIGEVHTHCPSFCRTRT